MPSELESRTPTVLVVDDEAREFSSALAPNPAARSLRDLVTDRNPRRKGLRSGSKERPGGSRAVGRQDASASSGLQFLAEAATRRPPRASRMIITGWTEADSTGRAPAVLGVCALITKPWEDDRS